MSYNIKTRKFLEEQMEDFLDELETLGKSENTIKSYKQTINSFLIFLSEYKKGLDFTKSGSVKSAILKFLKYKNDTLQEHYTEIKQSSKILYVTHLKRFFKNIEIATNENYNIQDIFRMLQIKKPERNPKTHNKFEIENLLKYLENNILEAQNIDLSNSRSKNKHEAIRRKRLIANRDSLIIKIYLYTGIRASELIGLSIDDLKRYENIYEFTVIGKGNKRKRCFIFSKEINNEIDFYKNNHLNRIAISINGKDLDRVQIWKMIKRRFTECGFDSTGVHKFRHLFAKTIYEKTKNIVTTQQMLGHSSVNTTSIYTQEEEETTRDNYIKAMQSKH